MNKRCIFISLLSVLFICLTVVIMLNYTESFDNYVYSLVTFRMTPTITSIYKVFTFLGSTLFIVLLTVGLFIAFLLLKKKNHAFITAIVMIVSTIFNNVIKIIVRRARPLVNALVVEKTYSFPSGHMMGATSIYGLLIYLILKSHIDNKYKHVLCVLLALLPIIVGISRIYLGVHFCTDIIGGAILSTLLLLIEIEIIEKKNILK